MYWQSCLQNKGFRHIEALVVTLILTIGFCFGDDYLFPA